MLPMLRLDHRPDHHFAAVRPVAKNELVTNAVRALQLLQSSAELRLDHFGLVTLGLDLDHIGAGVFVQPDNQEGTGFCGSQPTQTRCGAVLVKET